MRTVIVCYFRISCDDGLIFLRFYLISEQVEQYLGANSSNNLDILMSTWMVKAAVTYNCIV